MNRTIHRFVILMLLMPLAGVVAEVPPPVESDLFSVDTSIPRIDTDNDGMVDAWEIANNLDPDTDDAGGNPDGDTFLNIEEYNAGLDPHTAEPVGLPQDGAAFTLSTRSSVSDADADAMPDWWEALHGLNISSNDAGLDSDGDGRTNRDEYDAGTNPRTNDWAGPYRVESGAFLIDTGGYPFDLAADSEGDGMPDWWEYKYGLDLWYDDSGDDADVDGLSNLAEYLLGSNPRINDVSGIAWLASSLWHMDTAMRPPDTDGDGMRDWWEIANGTDPDVDDDDLDPDLDGRTNIEEYNAGTDPLRNDWLGPTLWASLNFHLDTGGFNGGYSDDSDHDGMPDWWEIKYGLNPGVDDRGGNPDEDALTNIEEYNAGTNPIRFDWFTPDEAESLVFVLDTGGYYVDTDGDLISNWWERKYGGDTTNILADADLDSDKFSNLGEFAAGTSPIDAEDFFIVQHSGIETNTGSLVIYWDTVPGRIYSVFACTNVSSAWTNSIHSTSGDGTRKSYAVPMLSAKQYFRIRVELDWLE